MVGVLALVVFYINNKLSSLLWGLFYFIPKSKIYYKMHQIGYTNTRMEVNEYGKSFS